MNSVQIVLKTSRIGGKNDQILFKNNLFVSQNEDMNIFLSIDGKTRVQSLSIIC